MAMYSIVTLSPALCVWNITLGGAPPGGGAGTGCWKKAPSGIVLTPASCPTTHEQQSIMLTIRTMVFLIVCSLANVSGVYQSDGVRHSILTHENVGENAAIQ